MQDISTGRRFGFAHTVTGARDIAAFVRETLEKPKVGAAIEWLSERSRSGQPSVFPTEARPSRWVHATSLKSDIKINNSAMERDNDTIE
jgi:hypothetical protein